MCEVNKLTEKEYKENLRSIFNKKRQELKQIVGKQYIKKLDITEDERTALYNFNTKASISHIEWCIDILDKEKVKLLDKIKRTQVGTKKIINHTDVVEFDLTQSVDDIIESNDLIEQLVNACLKTSGVNTYELSEEIGKGRKFVGNLLNGDYDKNPVLKKEGVELLKTHLELQQLEKSEVMDEKDKEIIDLKAEMDNLVFNLQNSENKKATLEVKLNDCKKELALTEQNLYSTKQGYEETYQNWLSSESKLNRVTESLDTLTEIFKVVDEEKTLYSWDVERLNDEMIGKDSKIHTLETELQKITERAVELKKEVLDKQHELKMQKIELSEKNSFFKALSITVIFALITFIVCNYIS